MRKKHRKEYIRRQPIQISNEQKERLLLVKSLYDEHRTLDKVGEKLGITRERVRQLLIKGQKYNLYEYELSRDKDFNNLLSRVSKEAIIKSLYSNPKRFVVCSDLNITISDLFKLLKHYHIDIEDYKYDIRQKKYLLRYSRIVDDLGHHPTTTEMNKIPKWRATWIAITRIWGSIDKFRQEFGIDKPLYHMHPNTLLAFNKSKQKMLELKKIKIDKIIGLISTNGPISCINIQSTVGYSRPLINQYLRELRDKNLINQIGVGSKVIYSIKQVLIVEDS